MTSIVFLTMIFGIMDYGRLLYSRNSLAHAAREGARYAIVRGHGSFRPATSSDIAGVVQRQAIGVQPLTVSVTWTPDNKPGSVVQVDVQYGFTPVLPLTKLRPVTLRSTSRMRISQ